ncbi:DEAD/DEAH box helicase [Candidatus Bathyarchaeota archaeon]|nr:DEAD/DEAH box helicase [Candidatus Bathyarchaeota archaeon]
MSFQLHPSMPKLFDTYTAVQEKSIPLILQGENLLIVAPTGSGKTEAAFLPVLSMYLRLREDGVSKGIYIVYVTPLRALNRDIYKRLIALCREVGVSVDVRHGDTPRSVRRIQSREPPEVLITTPETLQAILVSSGMRKWLSKARWIIIDEVHSLLESKRGVQLTVGLERLKNIANNPQIIGLSATVQNPALAVKFLSGSSRLMKIVIDEAPKPYEFKVEAPKPTSEDSELAVKLQTKPETAARIKLIAELMDKNKPTLVFTNCREYAEYLSSRFRLMGFETSTHHSSLSKTVREQAEMLLKQGLIPAVICTSSLELGIDVGRINLTIQYLSPRQVTAFIQRTGRSGHSLDKTSKGLIASAGLDDLLESLAIQTLAIKRKLEEVKIHSEALDVLAHQVAGIVLDNGGGIKQDEALIIIRRSYPYRSLSQRSFKRLLTYMDRLGLLKLQNDYIAFSRRTRAYYYRHLSTIPEELKFPVYNLENGEEIAYLGEDFFSEYGKPGVKVILRGKPWIIKSVEGDRVYVKPTDDFTAAIPGWEGEVLPTSHQVALTVGMFRRRIAEQLSRGNIEELATKLAEEFNIEKAPIVDLLKVFEEHLKVAVIPSDRVLLVEGFDRYVVVHSCFGHGVNRILAKVLTEKIKQKFKEECIARCDAYRILFILSNPVNPLSIADMLKQLSFNESLKILKEHTDPYIIRHVAVKFDAIPKNLYYKSASFLTTLSERFKDTPVYEEAFRFQLTTHYDLKHFSKLLNKLKNGAIKISIYRGEKPTPIAMPIVEVGEIPVTERIDFFEDRIMNRTITLLCLDCLNIRRAVIKELPEYVNCDKCSSRRTTIVKWRIDETLDAIRKLKRGLSLTEEEEDLITRVEMSSNLLSIYGKRAAVALAVKGIGPLTAHQILAKPHKDHKSFMQSLQEAMKEYLETRDYW